MVQIAERRKLAEEDCRGRPQRKTAEEDCRGRLQRKTAEEDCRGRPQRKTAEEDWRSYVRERAGWARESGEMREVGREDGC